MEASRAKAKAKGSYLDFSRLHRGEYVGMVGSAILALSLFLPWFSTASCTQNPNSRLETAGVGCGHSANAFDAFNMLGWWLLAACAAPFILSWIIARSHKLTWRPGEITMIVGIIAFALIIINGIIFGKPKNDVDISFDIGYLVGIIGAMLICVAGVVRQAEGGRTRKAPGTL
jgi:hypothetical protein